MLMKNEEKYLDLLDILILILDRNGIIKYINDKGCEICGCEKDDIIGKNWFKTCIPEEKQREISEIFKKIIAGTRKLENYENPIITKDGKEKIIKWYNKSLIDEKGNLIGVISSGIDITKQKKSEKFLKKMNRLLRMQSLINFLSTSVKNESDLYKALCNNIIEVGCYQFCWVGLVEYNESKTIRPVAHAGYGEIDLNSLNLTWADTEKGQEPPGKSIRLHKNIIERDIERIPSLKSWPKLAGEQCYKSTISLPIIVENIVISTVNIYSSEINTFDDYEVEILTEMIRNISQTVAKMRYYEIQQKNEQKLIESNKKFKTIFEAIPDLFFLISRHGEFLEFYGDESKLHIPINSLINKKIYEIFQKEIADQLKEKTIEVYKNKKPQIVEFPLKNRNNKKEFYEARILYYDEQKIAVLVRNISKRKARVEKLIETEGRLKNINFQLEKEVKNRTKELASAKDQLNLILNTLEEPIFVFSEDYEILFYNENASKIFPGEIKGKKCFNELKGKKYPCEFCPIRNILIEKDINSIKFENTFYIKKYDDQRTFEIKCNLIKKFEGKPAMLEILSDITERKEKERKIIKSELMLQGRVKQLKCLYGISSLLVVPDITIKELLYGVLPLIRSSFQYPEITMVKIKYGKEEITTNNYNETQWKLSLFDKINEKPLKIEVSYSKERKFLYEETRLIKEILTRLKLGIISIENKLEMRRLADIVENSSDAILSTDIKGIFKTWNKGAEEIYGYSQEEIIGKSINILVPKNRLQEIPRLLNKILHGEFIKSFETKRLRKDGKELDVNLTVSPILNLKGEIIGVSSISRDVTDVLEEQKKYQEQLIKSSQFKSEFMASMSHELRTPLNSIIGFTDILLEKFYGKINEKQNHYLKNVKTSAEHLLNLINDILDISKIEAGKVELVFKDFNLENLLIQIKTELKPLYKKKKLKFDMIGIKKGTIIRADPIRLKEILINLLGNAIKYTEKGKIQLILKENKDFWEFDVIDTGIGIAEEDFDIIFKDFKRVNSDYVNCIEGTGLGLMLTKKLVELHGGNIRFTSELGEGSTFSFTIPKKRSS
ncbi:MAG: PAS domain S-box protein [Promethearchaeota archaeon]